MSTPRTGRKISQLPTLETASLDVYVVGISGDTTYKLTLDALEDAVINTLSASLDNRVDFLETFSSSYNQFSSSVNAQLNANSSSALEFRLDELESHTASYATTGSNSFTGSQSIQGAVTASFFKGDGSALTNVTGALSVALLDEGVYKGGVTTFNFSGSNVVSSIVGGVALVEVKTDNTLLSTSSFNSFSASVDSRIIAATNEGQFATTGSNQFDGYQYITGAIEIYSASNPELRFVNGTTGIEYHIQNGDGGHFQIHNKTTGNLLFKFLSASAEQGNQDAYFYSNLNVSESISSNIIYTDYINATDIEATSLTGAIFATNGVISSSAQIANYGFATTGSNHFIGNQYFTGSLIPEGSGSHDLGSLENPWQDLYITSASIKLVKDSQIITILSANEAGDLIISSSTGGVNMNYYFDTASFAKVDLVNNLIQQTSSYETTGRGIISGSSQLTASYDSRYVLSGSITQTTWDNIASKPSDIVSSSSQLTSSYDLRYTLSGSVQPLPSNLVSSSAQITAFGFISSSQTINTASLATTGSNSFNGNQTITGSLIVSSVAVVNGGITIPTGSVITLTSGSSISVDASGAITGSLTGSVFGIGDVVAFSASLNSRIISGSSVAGTVSGSSQLTSSFDTRYAASGSAPTLFLLEAYANETYTLPGTFTEDPCRYSVVSNTVNVSSAWFNTSTYTFTPLKAGYWEIIATYDVYRNSEASMAIRKNGGVVAAVGSFGAVAQQVTKIVYLNGSTDYIDVINAGGASFSRNQYFERSWFQAKWIGQ